MQPITSTHKERFAICYRAACERHGLIAKHGEAIYAKMLQACYDGTMDKDGPAIKETMRGLGIKPTYKALREFFARDAS